MPKGPRALMQRLAWLLPRPGPAGCRCNAPGLRKSRWREHRCTAPAKGVILSPHPNHYPPHENCREQITFETPKHALRWVKKTPKPSLSLPLSIFVRNHFPHIRRVFLVFAMKCKCFGGPWRSKGLSGRSCSEPIDLGAAMRQGLKAVMERYVAGTVRNL
jgi:hypothetical protein